MITTTNTTVNYNVTVQLPEPYWQAVSIALIPFALMIVVLLFVFPRVVSKLFTSKNIGCMEGYQPYTKDRKKNQKHSRKKGWLWHKLFAWQVRNKLLTKHEFENPEDLK